MCCYVFCTWLYCFNKHILNQDSKYVLHYNCCFEVLLISIHWFRWAICKPSSHKRDIGKQCRPRSDAAERSVWSWSTLFALNTNVQEVNGVNRFSLDMKCQISQLKYVVWSGTFFFFFFFFFFVFFSKWACCQKGDFWDHCGCIILIIFMQSIVLCFIYTVKIVKYCNIYLYHIFEGLMED